MELSNTSFESYDEDLSQNPFYLRLKSKYSDLFLQIQKDGLILCIPAKNKLPSKSASKSELQAHILRPVESSDGEQKFTSLSGGEVHKKGRHLELSSGYDIESVEILFNEDFFDENDGHKLFTMYCISNSLTNPQKTEIAEEQLTPSSSLFECQQYLLKHGGPESYREIRSLCTQFKIDVTPASISTINEDPEDSQLDDVIELTAEEQVAESVGNLFIKVLHCLPKSVRHKVEIKSPIASSIALAAETVMLDLIYTQVIQSLQQIFSSQDAELNKQIRNLLAAKPEQFGVNTAQMGDVPGAIKHLSAMQRQTNCLNKFQQLQQTVEALMRQPKPTRPKKEGGNRRRSRSRLSSTTSENEVELETLKPATPSVMTADDLVPLLCYALVRTREAYHWFAQLHFMRLMGFSDAHRGTAPYFLTSLEVAATHLATSSAVLEQHYHQDMIRPASPSPSIFGIIPETAKSRNRSSSGTISKTLVEKFLESVIDGDVERVKFYLLSESSSVVDTRLCHPLCQCEKCQQIHRAEDARPDKPNIRSKNGQGQTALHLASANNHGELVDFLIDAGANVDEGDDKGLTPLHLACQNDSTKAALVLLMSGASPLKQDDLGNTPLHICVSNGHARSVKLLLSNASHEIIDQHNSQGDTSLHIASRLGFIEIVKVLLSHGCKTYLKNSRRQKPFDVAHSQTIADLLMESQPIFRKSRSATMREHSRASPNLVRRQTSMRSHRQSWNISSAGSTPVLPTRDISRQITKSPSLESFPQGSQALVRSWSSSVLSRSRTSTRPASPDASISQALASSSLHHDDNGDTERYMALAFQAIQNDDIDQLKWLLGIRSTASSSTLKPTENHDPLCQCPRCKASDLDNEPMITVNSTNSEGFTCLHMASVHGNRDMVQLLLKHAANVNAKTDTYISALHFSCQYGHDQVTSLLLQYGANVSTVDGQGNTPLHMACTSSSLECVRHLIRAGADVNATDARGNTGLHRASQWAAEGVLRCLIAHGARVSLRNSDGKTAREISSSESIRQLLSFDDSIPMYVDLTFAEWPESLQEFNPSGHYLKIGQLPEAWTEGVMLEATQQGRRPLYLRKKPHHLYLFYHHRQGGWAIATVVGNGPFYASCQGNSQAPELDATWQLYPHNVLSQSESVSNLSKSVD